jgi:hypothetical protein
VEKHAPECLPDWFCDFHCSATCPGMSCFFTRHPVYKSCAQDVRAPLPGGSFSRILIKIFYLISGLLYLYFRSWHSSCMRIGELIGSHAFILDKV